VTEDEATEVVSSLYESWYSFLVRYASRLTGSVDSAEDVAQEAFMHLYREMRAGKPVDNPKAWTLCIVRRAAARQRLRTRHQENVQQSILESSLVSTPDQQESAFEIDQARKLFSVLTVREEEVISLRVAGMKYREIARHLGVNASSVNTLLARALRKLRMAANDPPSGSALNYARDGISKTLQ
jgi:RNA polymerase sigma factor (sigma-70 family)